MAEQLGRCAIGLAAVWISGTTLSTASGALIKEDFAYTSGLQGSQNGALVGNSTVGDGFSAPWAGNSTRVYVRADDLVYSGGGYDVVQAVGSNRAGTGYSSEMRGLYRNFSEISGTVWFSFLVRSESSSASPFVAVQWNPSTLNNALSANYIQLLNGAINVSYNGVLTSSVKTGLAINTTHLVVGRWVIGAGNDALDVWVNPASLTSLGVADFSQSNANIGSGLTRLGLMGLSTSADRVHVFADAIRISDGNGNSTTAFGDVTGVPEPASMGLLAGAALGLARRRRRSR